MKNYQHMSDKMQSSFGVPLMPDKQTPEERIRALEDLMYYAHEIINKQQELIDGYQLELEALGY